MGQSAGGVAFDLVGAQTHSHRHIQVALVTLEGKIAEFLIMAGANEHLLNLQFEGDVLIMHNRPWGPKYYRVLDIELLTLTVRPLTRREIACFLAVRVWAGAGSEALRFWRRVIDEVRWHLQRNG